MKHRVSRGKAKPNALIAAEKHTYRERAGFILERLAELSH